MTEAAQYISDECKNYVAAFASKKIEDIEKKNLLTYEDLHDDVFARHFPHTLKLIVGVANLGHSKKEDHYMTTHGLLHCFCTFTKDSASLPMQQSFSLAMKRGSVADTLQLLNAVGISNTDSVMYKTLKKSAKENPEKVDYKATMEVEDVREQLSPFVRQILDQGIESEEAMGAAGIKPEFTTAGIVIDNYDEKLFTETKGSFLFLH